jgi:hypothetical protein
MNRYIEIIYDNSGSMNENVGNNRKYDIAQILFEKEILPVIGNKGDKVVLRLLRDNCNGTSVAELLPNTKAKMLERIKQISHDQATPLFYTIADAVEACRKEPPVDEYLIFVLTDGDDTCHVKINNVIDQNIIDRFIKIHNVNFLLTQLAIVSDISSNNLTSFTNYIGGRTVCLGVDDDLNTMRSKMKTALNVSGFSARKPLEHCYTKVSGFDMTWDEVEDKGIDFYYASLMHQFELIEWEPKLDKLVSPIQFEEMKFIYGLKFSTDLPQEYVDAMLSSLKQPYYYSHNCIYWDFSAAKWKYFKPQNSIRQVYNPGADLEDNVENNSKLNSNNFVENLQNFNTHEVYRVEREETIMPSFRLKPIGVSDWNIELKNGDQIRFRN